VVVSSLLVVSGRRNHRRLRGKQRRRDHEYT
jgi:hypothetical protein